MIHLYFFTWVGTFKKFSINFIDFWSNLVKILIQKVKGRDESETGKYSLL